MKKIIIGALIALTPLFAQVKEAVDIPYVSFEIKMGKGFDEVNANCLMCHSFGYILNQGPQSREFWRGKVHRMMEAFKAPINEQDAKSIENYLATYYGNGK